jgi:hypothetical protein
MSLKMKNIHLDAPMKFRLIKLKSCCMSELQDGHLTPNELEIACS